MSEPAVAIYGSPALRALAAARDAAAVEIARRLATMRTEGFRGKFTVVFGDGPILPEDIVMELRAPQGVKAMK